MAMIIEQAPLLKGISILFLFSKIILGNQIVNKTIPLDVEVDFFNLESKKEDKLYLEKLYVNVYMNSVDFVGLHPETKKK
jgi:hypothetical protein